MRLLIFGKANRTYPLEDWTSAICTSVASSDFGSGSASSCSLDHDFWSFFFVWLPKKCWKLYLFWYQFAFTHIKREALIYIIYPVQYLFKLLSAGEPWKIGPLCHIFWGLVLTLHFQSSEILRASLCKILISSFAHKMDLAHNLSVDFF